MKSKIKEEFPDYISFITENKLAIRNDKKKKNYKKFKEEEKQKRSLNNKIYFICL